MKVALIDLDINRRRRPFPNLALMKLSTYHRERGDDVKLNFLLGGADLVYASCVFSWNKKRRAILPDKATTGGAGISLTSQLPQQIEHTMPDYSLYPNVDFSLGFTSRGCHRHCPWCIVPQKEGYIRHNARIYEFWDRSHRKIVLLDNNLLASPTWQQTMDDLICEGLEVDFNQGLDIRLVTPENVDFLKRVKAHNLRFAFDSLSYKLGVQRGIELLLEKGIRSRKLSFYVLVGFPGDNTTLERMEILASYNTDVYPMHYKGPDGKEPERKQLNVPDIFWHGGRGNIRKFLRIAGRLPE